MSLLVTVIAVVILMLVVVPGMLAFAAYRIAQNTNRTPTGIPTTCVEWKPTNRKDAA